MAWARRGRPSTTPQIDAAAAEARAAVRRRGGAGRRRAGENPYTLHQELQQAMNDLVGIIRREAGDASRRWSGWQSCKERAGRVGVEGHRQFNPGWHLALDLRNMLLVSECVAHGRAGAHREPRRPHPRRPSRRWTASGARSTSCCELVAQQPVEIADATSSRCPRSGSTCFQLFDPERARQVTSPNGTRLLTRYLDANEETRRVSLRRRTSGSGGATPTAASCRTTPSRSTTARSSSTSSTGCRPPRPATWPSAGTARPASAARAAPRSTAGRG